MGIWSAMSGLGHAITACKRSELITLNTLLRCFKAFVMMRNSPWLGKQISTVMLTLYPMKDMLLVAILLYSTMLLTFNSVRGSEPLFSNDITGNATDVQWGIVYNLFQLAFIGDGGAWANLASLGEAGRGMAEFLTVIATLVFSVIMLNLLVAKYVSVYEALAPKMELNFWEMRAKTSFNRLLAHDVVKEKISCYYHAFDKWWYTRFFSNRNSDGASGDNDGGKFKEENRRKYSFAISFIAPIVLFFALLVIVVVIGNCTRADSVVCILAEVLFMLCCALCHFLIEHRIMDWCLEPFDEGPPKFLWICHRKDYSSDFLEGTLDKAEREELMDTLKDKVQQILHELPELRERQELHMQQILRELRELRERQEQQERTPGLQKQPTNFLDCSDSDSEEDT